MIEDNYKFRKYVYSLNKFNKCIGYLLEKMHNRKFIMDVINERMIIEEGKNLRLENFDEMLDIYPNKRMYILYKLIIIKGYNLYKK